MFEVKEEYKGFETATNEMISWYLLLFSQFHKKHVSQPRSNSEPKPRSSARGYVPRDHVPYPRMKLNKKKPFWHCLHPLSCPPRT